MNALRKHGWASALLAGTIALSAAMVLPATSILAHDGEHHAVEMDDVTFNPGPPTLPAGAEFAVLVGSPAEEGPFVMRLPELVADSEA